MSLKNHTVIEFTKSIENLSVQITTLKNELAANTQAIGFNTTAVEKITGGLKDLAKETGGWRSDDREHHKNEGELDKQKIQKMEDLNKTVKELVKFLKSE